MACFRWLLLAVLMVTPLCRALVPEISLKSSADSTNSHVKSVSINNDVISSETRTTGVGKWPTLNLTRVRTTATSYNVTRQRVIDDNFDVVDPDPSLAVGSVINTIYTSKDHVVSSTKTSKKTRHRNKWSHSTNQKRTSGQSSVWSKNDILSGTSVPTSLP